MTMTRVTYRTTDVSHNQYAIVPTIWLSDLLRWLTLSETAEIVGTTYNVDNEAVLPINWPSYQTCQDAIRISDAVHAVL